MLAYTISGSITDAAAFRSIAAQASTTVEAAEPGTLVYQWFLSEDETFGMLYEHYQDSDAFLAHLGNLTPMLDQFMAAIKIESVFAFGDVSDAAREALDGFGAVYGEMIGGFAR